MHLRSVEQADAAVGRARRPHRLTSSRRRGPGHGGVVAVGIGVDRGLLQRRGAVGLSVTHLPLDQPDLVAGPVLAREPFVLGVARRHPLAGRDPVTVEDLADHAIGRLELNAPRRLQDSLAPRQTPNGRPIQLLQMTDREPSETMLAIAQGRIAQPVTRTFAHTYRHPDVVFVPFIDLPAARSVLVWRRRDRHPRLREFLRVARDLKARYR